jgi:Uma2 family endonuclease
METVQHLEAMLVLYESLKLRFAGRSDVFVAANLSVYYSAQRIRRRDFRSPDVFVVLGAEPRTEPRKTWTVWEEGGRYPDVIIELLSDSTQREDRTAKRRLYASVWRVPYYFLFDPHRGELVALHLVDGEYGSLAADPQGRYWCAPLGLSAGVHDEQMRFFDADGTLLSFDAERAITERQRAVAAAQRAEAEAQRAEAEAQRADAATRRADAERARAERLAARLRELGIDPDRG